MLCDPSPELSLSLSLQLKNHRDNPLVSQFQPSSSSSAAGGGMPVEDAQLLVGKLNLVDVVEPMHITMMAKQIRVRELQVLFSG